MKTPHTRRQFLNRSALGIVAAGASFPAPSPAVESAPGHLWRIVDDDTYYGGTFGSFNNKIVAVGSKWFMPYRVGHEESGTFKLVCSEDAGQRWTPVPMEPIPCYQVPSMMADHEGRLHLTLHHESAAHHLRLSPGADGRYHLDFNNKIGQCSPKFALAYDPQRQRLYFAHRLGGSLAISTLTLDGQVVGTKLIIHRTGTFPPKGAALYEDPQYQSITVDPMGVIHLIYTRTICFNETMQKDGKETTKGAHRYGGVFYLRSRDGGATWQDSAGNALDLPAALTTGTRIHLTEQDHDSLTIWGESIAADAKNIHVLYWAEDAASKKLRPHYVRLDSEGHETARSLPPLVTLHTALALDPTTGAVFAFGTNIQRNPILARVSDDGKSWSIASVLKDLQLRVPYAHTTCPQITSSGELLAALTDRPSAVKPGGDTRNKVYFFRFNTRAS